MCKSDKFSVYEKFSSTTITELTLSEFFSVQKPVMIHVCLDHDFRSRRYCGSMACFQIMIPEGS